MLAGALRLGVGDERVAGLPGEWVPGDGAWPAAGSITCGLARGVLADAVAVAVAVEVFVFAGVVAAPPPTDPLEPHPASAMTAVSVATWARMGRL